MALDSTKASQSEGLDHATLRRMVDVAAEMTEDGRNNSEKCRDYYDHQQLTSEELAVLKKRKQPALIINRIQRKVDAIVGIEQKGRVDPRGLPRNPGDEDAADVATKALVFVDDIERLDVKRSAFCYNLAIEGTGGVEVTVKKNRDGTMDPKIVRLRWEEIFYDPYSRELDFSDAGYTGVQKWMALEAATEFAQGYGGKLKAEEIEAMLATSFSASGNTYEDRPQEGAGTQWGDQKTKRVKLAYVYYRRGNQWRLALLCGGGVISDQPSPYVDEEGDPCNAMILQSCYIDRENRRYGMVHGWLPMQDEINKRRSKALHMLNSRQTMGQKGAVSDVALMKREAALPDGHIEYEQDPGTAVPSFAIVPNNDQLAGQFELLQESKSEIDMVGPNASLLGQLEGNNSGRAIIAQQQSGMAEIAPFYDNLRDWTIRVYRAIWNRIRQFWTEERWIRVTDEQERLKFVGVNTPKMQPVMDPMTGQPAMGQDGQPMMQPVIGPDGQPVLDNNVGALDIDIIVDMTPDYASLQMEQFEQLAKLAESGMVQVPPEVIIQASQLRDKAKLLEMLNGPEAQQKAAMQEQMAQAAAQAEIEDKQASARLKMAQAQKVMAEAQQAPEAAPDTMPLEIEKIRSAERQTAAKLGAEAEVRSADALKKRVEAEAIRAELALKAEEINLRKAEVGLKGQEVGITAKKADAEISHRGQELGLNERKMAAEARRGERQDGLAEKKVGFDARAAGVSDKKRKRVLTPERDAKGKITRVIEEEVD